MRCSCAAGEKSDLDLLDKAGDDGWKPLAISSIADLKRQIQQPRIRLKT
jgi:hypothetical protein